MAHVDPNYGAHFSLSLELGPAGDDRRVSEAWSALWTCPSPSIDGPWERSDQIDDTQQRIHIGGQHNEPPGRSFGTLTLGAPFPPWPFGFYSIREDEKTRDEPSDWLTLGIPVSAIQLLPSFDGSWSIITQPWLATICRALADIADHINRHSPIVLGVIGEECSGCWRKPTARRIRRADQAYPPVAVLTTQVIEERGGILVTADLWRELAPRIDPITLPSGLLYAPPVSGQP
jgi:hypothetical protein